MNLKRLRSFALVAELGSLSKAAAHLGIAQSLLSREISMPESAWGDRLFERTSRGMVLTDFGRRMRPEAGLLLDQAERLEQVASDSAGVLTGTVHAVILPSMSREVLPALFTRLRAEEPNVRLHITEGFSGDLDEQLSLGRLDMIVVNRYGRNPTHNEDILGEADTFLIGLPAAVAQLTPKKNLLFRDLHNLPMVLPSKPNGLRTVLDILGRQHHVRPDVVIEVDTLTAMTHIAMSGHAFTLLPRLAVKREVQAGLLAAVKIGRPAMLRTVALRLSTTKPLSKAARLVATHVKTIVTDLLEELNR